MQGLYDSLTDGMLGRIATNTRGAVCKAVILGGSAGAGMLVVETGQGQIEENCWGDCWGRNVGVSGREGWA